MKTCECFFFVKLNNAIEKNLFHNFYYKREDETRRIDTWCDSIEILPTLNVTHSEAMRQQ